MKFINLPKPKVFQYEDARRKLKRMVKKHGKEHSEYLLGIELNNSLEDIAENNMDKIYSLNHFTLEYITTLKATSKNFRNIPFLFGTYEVSPERIRAKTVFADITTYDFLILPLAFTMGPLGFAGMASLRALYWFGRKQWWRHEFIHAGHHMMAQNMLFSKEDYLNNLDKLPEVFGNSFYFVHESGLEELVTRWQSFKEGEGWREKLAGLAGLALYLEYSPFMGVRNALTDAKVKFKGSLNNMNIPPVSKKLLKAGFYASLLTMPLISLNITEPQLLALPEHVIDTGLVKISKYTVRNLNFRAHLWFLGSVLGALFATEKKGVKKFEEKKGTREYKFPYTYNPVKSFGRSIKTVRYFSKVWNTLPHYRKVMSTGDVSEIMDEFDAKLELKGKQKEFTVNLVEEILRDSQQNMINNVYVKGMFPPYFYYHAKELFE